MSFSTTVKNEILAYDEKNSHCLNAELAAYMNVCGELYKGDEGYAIAIHDAAKSIMVRIKFLIDKLYGTDVVINKNDIAITDYTLVQKILATTKLKYRGAIEYDSVIDPLVVASLCCKRAYIRAAFVACGSVADPQKQYHMEFVSSDYQHIVDLKELIFEFGIDAKLIDRKSYFVIYLKESEQIVDMLNIMSAHRALLDFENLRVIKEVRNNINRKVNCETANLNKTVSASVRQIDAIERIANSIGLDSLPDNLKQMAQIRMENPDSSLKALGELMTPAIGKSGVNHRLNKICEIAEQIERGESQ